MMTAGAKYKRLIARCALRPLKSEADLDIALEVAEALFLRVSALDEDEADYLKVLSDLIGAYEDVHYPIEGHSTPAEMLCWLMEVNDMKQVDLAKLLGVTSGRASEIANGVRDLSKAQILMVAQRFNVRADMFLSKKPKAARKVAKATKPSKEKTKMVVASKYTKSMAKPFSSRGVAETIGSKSTRPKKARSQSAKPKAK
jgi:antitoxin component HigA of HigAB toxin-antitoxin module